MIEEYKIEDHHVGFSTLEAMEECLKSMREINKVPPTYFNIVCKKETVEILDL